MPESKESPQANAVLRLFVVGDETHSKRAVDNLHRIVEELGGRFKVEVIDVLKDYHAALDAGVLIAPTLIITTSDTRVTVAGDLSDTNKVLGALKLITG